MQGSIRGDSVVASRARYHSMPRSQPTPYILLHPVYMASQPEGSKTYHHWTGQLGDDRTVHWHDKTVSIFGLPGGNGKDEACYTMERLRAAQVAGEAVGTAVASGRKIKLAHASGGDPQLTQALRSACSAIQKSKQETGAEPAWLLWLKKRLATKRKKSCKCRVFGCRRVTTGGRCSGYDILRKANPELSKGQVSQLLSCYKDGSVNKYGTIGTSN